MPVFVVLRTYDNYIPANMMLQRLEEEHIRAYLQDELTDPLFTHSAGGIKLMVHEGQVGRATELVNGFESLYRAAITCARCGSHNVHMVSHNSNPVNWLATLFDRLRGRRTSAVKNCYRCFNCMHEFDEPASRQEDIYLPFRTGFREDQQN